MVENLISRNMEKNTPETICLRLQSREKEIIDRAAKCRGKSSEAFIRESSLERAREILEEKTDFVLSPEQWEEFVEMLEQPSQENPGLDRIMAMVPLWECPEEGVGHQ